MGSIQKETPLFVDGAQSFVSSRQAARDVEEGWSLTVRPYRPKPSDDLLKDLSTSQCTCFLAGNRVLMADRTYKAIELVEVGDMVMTMSGPDRVRKLERPVLGMTRRVIEIHGLEDQCLFITDEHPLWISRRLEGQAAAVENWGVYNLNHFEFEQRNGVLPKIERSPYVLKFDLPEQVAHVSGWLHVRPIFHHLDPATPLFNVVTEAACSLFIEGFAVYSHGLGAQEPSTPWLGLAQDAGAAAFVRTVSAEAA